MQPKITTVPSNVSQLVVKAFTQKTIQCNFAIISNSSITASMAVIIVSRDTCFTRTSMCTSERFGCIHSLDWNTGLDYWTDIFWFLYVLWLF